MTIETRKAALDATLERIHLERYKDYDNFAREVANWFADRSNPRSDKDAFVEEFRTGSTFFQFNEVQNRDYLLGAIYSDVIDAIDVAPSTGPTQLMVADIDSFSEIGTVDESDINVDLPLDVPEEQVKTFLREIIDEPFNQQDWGGELTDLYTSRVRVDGRRVDTAFMLKGPSVSGEMFISDAGKRGDQFQRLFDADAELYVVQFNGAFDARTVRQIKTEADVAGANMFCIMDGADTARLLQAYGKIG